MKKWYGRGPSNGMESRWSQPHRTPHWPEPQMCRQKGFSLIELLIVVAIILIIAAIAIPNLLRARISANESAAVGALRTLNTAQISYNSTYPTVGFAGTLSFLAGTTCAYNLVASPVGVNQTGVRYFCSFADAVVRSNSA